MTYNAFGPKNDNEYIEKLSTNSPKKNYWGKLLGLFAGGCLLLSAANDYSRPIVKGEILGGDFSDQKSSEVFIQNHETNSIDTLVLKTSNNGLSFVLGNPDRFQGRARELEKKLTPGSLLEVKLHKENNVYKIKNIVQNNYDNKETDVLASF